MCGSRDNNARGLQIEKLISDHNLCLLNNTNPTYLHQPTRCFQTLDLVLCSPALATSWDINVDKDLHNSDHFPVILNCCTRSRNSLSRPINFIFDKGNWELFTTSAKLTIDMIQNTNVDDAVNIITDTLITAAELSIPRTSGKQPKMWKPWWNESCAETHKAQKKLWGKFRKSPTQENLISFKKAKSIARRTRRQAKRDSWIKYVSSIQSHVSSKSIWSKVRKATGNFNFHSLSFLTVNGHVISDVKEIADALAASFSEVSSENSYPRNFIIYKHNEEKNILDFQPSTLEHYNTDFNIHELKRSLKKSHPSSSGPDKIHYHMLNHLDEESLQTILFLFNKIWKEQLFPAEWRKAIVIPIPKPGKDPQFTINYRPIALTSCLCKLMERMVNQRLMYILEEGNYFTPFQSGFRQGRSTLDNLVKLETAVREAFVSRKHLISIFFDMEKAYDRAWRYGIMRDIYQFGLRGNLPIFLRNFWKQGLFKSAFPTLCQIFIFRKKVYLKVVF